MRDRMSRQAPVISATVSPRTRSAIRNAAICVGDATPDDMASSAVAISSSSRLAPFATFCSRRLSAVAGMELALGRVAWGRRVAAARAHARKGEKIGEQRVPLLGRDALGMELHAVH